MRDKVWTIFTLISTIAMSLFIIFIIYAFLIIDTSNDYRFAIIGALASIIGGSLTLVGVQITLQNQKNEKFISEFPRIITNLDKIKSELSRINNKKHTYVDFFRDNYSRDIKAYFNELKNLTINIDGKVYFIIKDLEREYYNHFQESRRLREYKKVESDFGLLNNILTNDSREKISQVQDSFLSVIQQTIEKIEEYEHILTMEFFKIKK
ncbi:hypothetical protein CHH83_01345 [Bacillus sp. 7586-K]|nr:hypothetical protein CHH83_01345 [Bacillus sp. 7586-K]